MFVGVGKKVDEIVFRLAGESLGHVLGPERAKSLG